MKPDETQQGEDVTVPAVSGADAGMIARAAFVGTALEWYDYFLFGTAAAIVFNRLFFTSLDRWVQSYSATLVTGWAAGPRC
jgi:hypothetical protein